MKNPSIIQRGLFIATIGFLLVGVLFTVVNWPAAELFTIIGCVGTLIFYAWFNWAGSAASRSVYARHVALGAFVIGQFLKVLEIETGAYFLLLALVAFLVWVVWSVLSELPPVEED